MWISEISDSLYYQERVRDRAGKTHIVSVKIRDRSKLAKKEAQEKLRQKVAQYETSDHMTLSDVAEIYNREQLATLRASTCHRNSCTLRTIISILGDMEMDKLSAGYIRERLIATGKGAGTINQYIKRFKGFLRWAYQYDYLKTSDVYEKLSYLKDTPHRMKIADKFLELDELDALLESMDVPRWRLLTEFLALSGLRIGEAIALDRQDIRDGAIHVYKTAQLNHENAIGDAKTIASVRDVHIQPELEKCIAEIDKAMKVQQNAMEITVIGNHPLFMGLNGQRMQYKAYQKYLKEKSYAVLGRSISPHALRHTHTSILAAQGVPFDVISRRLGHENSQVTREIYFHITRGLRLADAAKINKVVMRAKVDAKVTAVEPRKLRHVQ